MCSNWNSKNENFATKCFLCCWVYFARKHPQIKRKSREKRQLLLFLFDSLDISTSQSDCKRKGDKRISWEFILHKPGQGDALLPSAPRTAFFVQRICGEWIDRLRDEGSFSLNIKLSGQKKFLTEINIIRNRNGFCLIEGIPFWLVKHPP